MTCRSRRALSSSRENPRRSRPLQVRISPARPSPSLPAMSPRSHHPSHPSNRNRKEPAPLRPPPPHREKRLRVAAHAVHPQRKSSPSLQRLKPKPSNRPTLQPWPSLSLGLSRRNRPRCSKFQQKPLKRPLPWNLLHRDVVHGAQPRNQSRCLRIQTRQPRRRNCPCEKTPTRTLFRSLRRSHVKHNLRVRAKLNLILLPSGLQLRVPGAVPRKRDRNLSRS